MPEGVAQDKKFSPLGQLRDKMRATSAEQMRRFGDRELKALILWLETEQFETALMVSMEDDPVENAKGRGKVELLTALNGHLFSLLGQRARLTKESKEEEDA